MSDSEKRGQVLAAFKSGADAAGTKVWQPFAALQDRYMGLVLSKLRDLLLENYSFDPQKEGLAIEASLREETMPGGAKVLFLRVYNGEALWKASYEEHQKRLAERDAGGERRPYASPETGALAYLNLCARRDLAGGVSLTATRRDGGKTVLATLAPDQETFTPDQLEKIGHYAISFARLALKGP